MTTIEESLSKLQGMRLGAMAAAARELLQAGPGSQLDFAEMLGIIVDREWTHRTNRRISNRIKAAKLKGPASLEDVFCDTERGVAKSLVRQLSSCQWVRDHHNIIVVGNTGVGKSYFGSALADAACRAGFSALFARVPRLLEEFALARASGTTSSLLHRLAKVDVLVLDDFLVTPLSPEQQRDLLELFEDRYDHSSTVITTQMKTKTWHAALGDPTIADAICDRVIHNSHVIPLSGPSIRLRKALAKQPTP